MHTSRWLIVVIVLLAATGLRAGQTPAFAQTAERPFILPVQGEPGPSTWMLGQAYGNTVGAYNFGTAWYSAGQGLHFGLDFPMPCGTPLVAVADGEVVFVDNFGFGSGPHNLIVRHPQVGLTVLYGHLLNRPSVLEGQPVRQGEVIAESGDPDSTCDSRPHLHFEVRSLDFRTAYNPVDYTDANWHSLAVVGSYSSPLFQQDMDNARRWMSLDDQPAVAFGGRRLNDYIAAWPLPSRLRPPENPLPPRSLGPLPADGVWSLRQIGFDQCCRRWWWHPTDPDLLYVIDGTAGQRAGVFSWSAQQGNMTAVVRSAPPAVASPDASYEIDNRAGQVYVRRVADGGEIAVPTQGNTPAISADNSFLMWTVRGGDSLPGQAFTSSQIWVSNLDGTDARVVYSQPGASAQWLNDSRLLLRLPEEGRITNLHVTDVRDITGTVFALGTWRNMRGLRVAPGGDRVMFYLTWQDNPADDGIYVLETDGGDFARPVPLFGSWRWRDSESVYFLMFDPASRFHTFAYYNVITGATEMLQTAPGADFTVMNGEWEVSADGRSIVFQNALDGNMWLLELTG